MTDCFLCFDSDSSTSTKYKAYPTYDFACPIVDSIEGVTHALRTNEYRDRNAQYYWVCDALRIRKPIIRDYSRLNFVYTTLSKRKLTWFVDTGRVGSWNDPRMPTIQGFVRRGLTVRGLKAFIHAQGFSQAVNMMEYDKLWTLNKQVIDPEAHRYTAITCDYDAPPVKLTLTGVSGSECVSIDLHPKHPEYGQKVATRSATILIEQTDAQLIAEGEEVTLLNWGNVIVKSIHRDTVKSVSGEKQVVRTMNGSFKGAGDVKSTKKITWIDASADAELNTVPVTLVELDSLIGVAKVEDDMNFEDIVRPQSWYETRAAGEVAMSRLEKGQIIQLNRRGFAIVEETYRGLKGFNQSMDADSTDKGLVLIMIPDGKQKAASGVQSKVALANAKPIIKSSAAPKKLAK